MMTSDNQRLEDMMDLLGLQSQFDNILNSYRTKFRDGKLISLDLIKVGITNLPEDIFDRLEAIESLFLSYNKIETLPNGIFRNCKNLIHLDLRGMGLQSIPEGIFNNLLKLKKLEINDNRLTTLPENIFENLFSLVELNLSNNNISELSPIIFDNLGHLERLFLYFNPLPNDVSNGDYYDREGVLNLIHQLKNLKSR